MQVADCIFCKIVLREIPGNIVYEDDDVIAFHDKYPVAPVHLIIIPKHHLRNVNDITPEYETLIGHLFGVIKRLAEEFEVSESGYRVATNTGTDGGQFVGHLHFHLIGGKALNVDIG